MDEKQIKHIQAYKGDEIEEQWKPNKSMQKPYIDLFYYWEFREAIVAGNLSFLRPRREKETIAKKVLYQHERLAGYYYSAYVRLAAMHKCLNALEGMLRENNPKVFIPPSPAILDVTMHFEGFYHFLGAVVDMLGGVGNILYGFGRKEDSFSDFKKSFGELDSKTELESQTLAKLSAIDEIKDYRDHIVHRPAFAMHEILGLREGDQIALVRDIKIERDYKLAKPQGTKMWRSILRGMWKDYIESVSIIDLCREHLGQIEEIGNRLFHCFLERIPQYLDSNGIRIIRDRTQDCADLDKIPTGVELVLYLCADCENRQSRLSVSMQKLASLTGKCDLCGESNVFPMYFVSE